MPKGQHTQKKKKKKKKKKKNVCRGQKQKHPAVKLLINFFPAVFESKKVWKTICDAQHSKNTRNKSCAGLL